jgi:hypothetical protein
MGMDERERAANARRRGHRRRGEAKHRPTGELNRIQIEKMEL